MAHEVFIHAMVLLEMIACAAHVPPKMWLSTASVGSSLWRPFAMPLARHTLHRAVPLSLRPLSPSPCGPAWYRSQKHKQMATSSTVGGAACPQRS